MLVDPPAGSVCLAGPWPFAHGLGHCRAPQSGFRAGHPQSGPFLVGQKGVKPATLFNCGLTNGILELSAGCVFFLFGEITRVLINCCCLGFLVEKLARDLGDSHGGSMNELTTSIGWGLHYLVTL